MARYQLPTIPDFDAIELEAPKHADRQTMILSLIGNLVFSWSNNESMFIYILMILLDTDEPTAVIVFVTLNTTRARLDLIQRLSAMKITDPAVSRALRSLIRQFNSCTRLRNEFNHSMYVLNEHGEITHMQSMRLEEDHGAIAFGSTRELSDERISEIVDAIRRLKKLNREIWNFLPRLRDGMSAKR